MTHGEPLAPFVVFARIRSEKLCFACAQDSSFIILFVLNTMPPTHLRLCLPCFLALKRTLSAP